MVEVIPDVNLSFKEYQASLQQNPSNIFYQRIESRNASNQNCSFTVSSPNKRSYLLSGAQIEWRFTFTRQDTSAAGVPNGAAQPYVNSRDLITLKPVLPVANAISAITTSINGSTNTIAQPRRFMEAVSMMHVSREEAKLNFEAGYPEKMGGTMNQGFPAVPWSYQERDDTYMDQYYDFAGRQLRSTNIVTDHLLRFNAGAANVSTGGTIIVTEPLISPPFDCYSKISKHDMPDWSPWKWMSKVIPNVDRLEIDIQFTKLSASMMFFFQGKSGDANPVAMVIEPAGVVANLMLYWAEVPVSTSIPRSLDLQTWNIREFQNSTGAGVIADGEAEDTTSSLIQLQSVPSLIITHLERDKDQPDYQPSSYCHQTTDVAAAPANLVFGDDTNNWDFWGEINTITYLLGDRPNVISATFSQRELYDLTVKNSKNFPYTFEDWRGRKRPQFNAGTFRSAMDVQPGIELVGADWLTYACKGMVAVTGADIANKTSTGVFSSNSLQIQVNWRPHGSFAGGANNDYRYQLYNHLLFGKEFLRIEPDKSQYQSQSLDESTARRLTDPPLGSMSMGMGTGGSLRVGGSLGVGGSLAPLRDRGVSSIGSRLP